MENPQRLLTVRLKVRQDLGLRGNQTTNKIYGRAEELGWDLCPADVGPYLCLDYARKKRRLRHRPLYIAMKQLIDSDGGQSVFALSENNGRFRLYRSWARSDEKDWSDEAEFVFTPSLDKVLKGPNIFKVLVERFVDNFFW